VPPPSTIQGILSAAKGEPVYLTEMPYFGYVFRSEGKGTDLEKIYALGKIETDIMKREFHYNAELYLYLPDEWQEAFKMPRYQLLLGRSSDIATVEEVKKVELEEREVPLGGTVVPLDLGVPGMVHALVVEYDYSTVPRRARLVKPFVVLPFPRTPAEKKRQTAHALYDPEVGIGVYLHRWSE
jgi:CRISPR-associated protein Cas5t